jgi:hypothetical protein
MVSVTFEGHHVMPLQIHIQVWELVVDIAFPHVIRILPPSIFRFRPYIAAPSILRAVKLFAAILSKSDL